MVNITALLQCFSMQFAIINIMAASNTHDGLTFVLLLMLVQFE